LGRRANLSILMSMLIGGSIAAVSDANGHTAAVGDLPLVEGDDGVPTHYWCEAVWHEDAG
jgi:hypothetical protein